MNLQELIDHLIDLRPESARTAKVNVSTKTTDAEIISVDYIGGEVKLEVDDLPTSKRYDEGFEAGLKQGRKEAEEDAND